MKQTSFTQFGDTIKQLTSKQTSNEHINMWVCNINA